MSTSDHNLFDGWIAAEFAERGAFTALVILLDIDGHKVMPLCSTYLSVIGDEVDWGEITVWEPPRRLGYLWHIRTDRADATEVEIGFFDRGDSTTRVDIEHRGEACDVHL